MPLEGYTSPKENSEGKELLKAMATTQKDEAKGSKDGGPTNPNQEVQDDAPVNSKKPEAEKKGDVARKGFQQASTTPLPAAEESDEDARGEADGKDPEKLGRRKARDEVQLDEDQYDENLEAQEDEESEDDDSIPDGQAKKAWKDRIKAI